MFNELLHNPIYYVGEGIQDTIKYLDAISKIVEMSPEHGEYKEQLHKILNIICDMPWMSIRTTASIFIVSDNSYILELYSRAGLSINIIQKCSQVHIDLCMAGLAVKTGKMIFKSSLQKEDCPHIKLEDMTNRGQYSVPIIYKEKVLGVLSINVHEGHETNDLERQFLTDIAKILSLIVRNQILMDSFESLDKFAKKKYLLL
ncbi:MAG: hypothetical protein HQK98_01920 [Nitrospirae bacterium]|nr:hypothetical protein [Nitrospirota bacterium]